MVILEPSTTKRGRRLGVVRIPIFARVVRSSVLSVKENEYIEAVRALALVNGDCCSGISCRIAWLLSSSPVPCDRDLYSDRVVTELSGLGTQPPTPSWGWI